MSIDYNTGSYIHHGFEDMSQVRELQSLVEEVNPDRVLEVGSAAGQLLWRIGALGPTPVGVDVNHGALAVSAVDNVARAEISALPFPDDVFDLSLAVHVLEHVDDLEVALAEMARVTKPGGEMFLAYPAEPVRGLFAVGGSIKMFGHPFAARSLHLHKLNPTEIEEVAEGVSVNYINSKLRWLPLPQYFTRLGVNGNA